MPEYQQPAAPQDFLDSPLEEARCDGLRIVGEYRGFVTSLESRRIHKSRAGHSYWTEMCDYHFESHVAYGMLYLIIQVGGEINKLFGDAAASKCALFDQIEERIRGAESNAQIWGQLQIMDATSIRISEHRRREVVDSQQYFISTLDEVLHFIDLRLDGQWYDEVCTMIFATEPNGSYCQDPSIGYEQITGTTLFKAVEPLFLRCDIEYESDYEGRKKVAS
jgi:hypothetical protein